MTEHALREDKDGVAIVTLNRPDKLNAITIAMRETIFRAVDDVRESEDLRMLLIRANGTYFSAGIDIVEYYKTRNPTGRWSSSAENTGATSTGSSTRWRRWRSRW